MLIQNGLELIQSFVIVAEELNFRRSAERLRIDQSALSRRIKKLEQLLGFALFERTTREVTLTPAGRVFYERNVQLHQEYSSSVEAARLVADGKIGVLRIGYISFAAICLMPQAVSVFREEHPDVDIQLRSLRTQYQKVALANGEIDLGYMLGPFEHSEFSSAVLEVDPLYVAMPVDHPLAKKRELAPADLAGVNLIRGNANEWRTYNQRLDELFSGEGVQLQHCLEAPNVVAAVGFLTVGMGATIFPKSFLSSLGPGIAARPINHPDFFVQQTLAWRSSNRSAMLHNFIEVATTISTSQGVVQGAVGAARATRAGGAERR